MVRGVGKGIPVSPCGWVAPGTPCAVRGRSLPGLTGLCSHLPSLILDSIFLAGHEPHQPQHPSPWIPAHEPPDHNGAEEAAKKGAQEFM